MPDYKKELIDIDIQAPCKEEFGYGYIELTFNFPNYYFSFAPERYTWGVDTDDFRTEMAVTHAIRGLTSMIERKLYSCAKNKGYIK